MTTSVPLLVFTDLDGTLLDHDTYAHAAAAPALAGLAAIGAPVILASSKTAAEIAPLRSELALDAYPAIVENGAGLLPPGAQADGISAEYRRLRECLDTVPAEVRKRFRGFGDMSDADVADITGLSLTAAALARQRAFSEPGMWDGNTQDEASFVSALTERGLQARRGGRFLTLSFGVTKADRMAEIIDTYQPALTVALGDAPNDREMLETADIGVVVANPHASPLPQLRGEAAGRIRRTQKPGPSGWNAAMLTILSDL